jgi:N-acetylglucosaminyldiphosphoundecaprenol N-acetyl-beta-D-mannosaminyltransferase
LSGGASVPRIDLLGMPIAKLATSELIDHVFRELAEGRGGWILTANLDKLQRFATDASTAALYSGADLIVADGIPLMWASRLQGTPLPDRVAGSDLVWSIAERLAQSGRTLYLLGGGPGAAEGAARRFRERWPSLRICGIASPRISPEPSEAELAPLRESLRETMPDLVYVALGAPKEERLIAALRDFLPSTWWIGVGISLSFVSGEVTRAPAWMQKTGIEWLHRMLQEPRRLARRYLIDNLPFLLRLLTRAWRARS